MHWQAVLSYTNEKMMMKISASALVMLSWESKGTPPMPSISHHHPLIRPYSGPIFFGGGGIGGVPLDSHDVKSHHVLCDVSALQHNLCLKRFYT